LAFHTPFTVKLGKFGVKFRHTLNLIFSSNEGEVSRDYRVNMERKAVLQVRAEVLSETDTGELGVG
jgi:hypothetical protein